MRVRFPESEQPVEEKNAPLSIEIRNDHARILHQLRQVIVSGNLERPAVSRVTVALGAHHLAEEETLYEPIKPLRHVSVGRAQQYHLVLDDLMDSIETSSQTDKSLHCRLLLLENLLEHHFFIVDQVLLPAFIGNFSMADQLVFGEEYRRRYHKYVAILTRRGTARSKPQLVTLPT